MTGLRVEHHRGHIVGEKEVWRGFTVEDEKELVFGMCRHYATGGFSGEPTDTVHLVMDQQTGIDGDAH